MQFMCRVSTNLFLSFCTTFSGVSMFMKRNRINISESTNTNVFATEIYIKFLYKNYHHVQIFLFYHYYYHKTTILMLATSMFQKLHRLLFTISSVFSNVIIAKVSRYMYSMSFLSTTLYKWFVALQFFPAYFCHIHKDKSNKNS